MEVQFCRNDDGNIAVGVGRWEGRTIKNPHPRRPSDLCRDCYVEAFGPQFVKVEVTGSEFGGADAFAIACARTGNDVTTGGVAELDPSVTNIAVLVAGGLVRVKPAEPARKATAGEKA